MEDDYKSWTDKHQDFGVHPCKLDESSRQPYTVTIENLLSKQSRQHLFVIVASLLIALHKSYRR